ncbi:hypothetical protein [Saccharopolyspora pogona]|uniref:hypothetical protein n=1 Tax=Saccharopolyspora pogona TaxID=333966 RepID=UPI001687F86A|nr:hypothetical protein [Saccharopolyspora pogona]
MTWRVAESLEVLRRQFNEQFPNRSTASDGGIGDEAHASRSSDHNPWYVENGVGVVTARDFTHDPANGMDIDRLTDELAASRDPRIKYIIANGCILDSRPGNNPWKWVKYSGSNPHNKHFHLSVIPELCDDTQPWNLRSFRYSVSPALINEGFLMALSDQEQRDLFKLVLDMHKLWFEMGFIQNKIDPKNPTKGADVLSDMALWVNRTLGLAAQGAEVDPQRVAEALKPVIGPVVAESVRAALGADNVAQADAIVNEITKRLGGVK